MKGARGRGRPLKRAILARRQPVGVEEMSRGGCRLASSEPLPPGSVGILAVNVEGEVHVELFRVSRSAGLPDAHGHHEVGVEFLPMPANAASLHELAARLDRVHGS